MVKGVLDSTSTSSDFYTVFDNIVATNPHLEKTITEVRNESNLFLCKILRFYTIKDLCLIKKLDDGKEYMCHMTHEMLSYEVSLNCMCDGTVKTDKKYGTYIEPFTTIYGVVANVRFKGNTDEKCLLSCLNYKSDNTLFSSVRNGEIRLKVGNSTLSLTGSRINLMTPTLLVNGLPYNEPKLNNYFDKSQINTIKSDTDAQIEELDTKIDNLNVEHINEILEQLNEIIESIDVTTIMSRIDELSNQLSIHNHDDKYYRKNEVDGKLDSKSDLNHTHSIYALREHNHDDKYYDKSTVNDLLSGKANTNHSHNYMSWSDYVNDLSSASSGETGSGEFLTALSNTINAIRNRGDYDRESEVWR